MVDGSNGVSWSRTEAEYRAEIRDLSEANAVLAVKARAEDYAAKGDLWTPPEAGAEPWTEERYKQAVSDLQAEHKKLLERVARYDAMRARYIEELGLLTRLPPPGYSHVPPTMQADPIIIMPADPPPAPPSEPPPYELPQQQVLKVVEIAKKQEVIGGDIAYYPVRKTGHREGYISYDFTYYEGSIRYVFKQKPEEQYIQEMEERNRENARLLEDLKVLECRIRGYVPTEIGEAIAQVRRITPEKSSTERSEFLKTPWKEGQYQSAVAELNGMRDRLTRAIATAERIIAEGGFSAGGGSSGSVPGTSSGSVPASGSIAAIAAELDLGAVASIHLIYAKLQLTQAMVAKSGAQQYMKKIEANQNEQKTVSDMLNRIRSGQADAKGKKGNATDGSWALPEDIKVYMKANGMSCPAGKNGKFTADELEAVAESFRTQQDKLSSSTQMDMVYVNDFMGQYNAFLQGANAAISKCIELLSELARGLR